MVDSIFAETYHVYVGLSWDDDNIPSGALPALSSNIPTIFSRAQSISK